MKVKNIPCKLFTEDSQDGLVKCKVIIMNEGKNRNGSSFSKESMINAEQTLMNRPLLCYIKKDDDGEAIDFGGHEIITKIIKTNEGYDLKYFYLETPIGIFPESCNVRYEEIDGENHMVADAFIWEGYSNEALSLLNSNAGSKDVSMEITILEANQSEDGILNIDKFRFNAVTLLGDDIIQGMNGNCNINIYSKTNYEEFVNEINKKIYSLEKEEEHLEQVETVELNEEVVEEVVEEVSEVCSTEDVVENDTYEEPVEEPTKILEVEIKDTVKEEFEQLKEKYELAIDELNTLKDSYSELVAKFEEMKDYKELKEFKQSYDKSQYETEIKEITSKFELDEEEYQELQEKALNGEIAKEQYEKELYCILGMKQMSNKSNFAKVEKSTHEVKVKIENKTSSVYGELGKKYSK